MKFLVLGAGLMGQAVAFDLLGSPKIDQIVLVDSHAETLNQLKTRFGNDKLTCCQGDVNDLNHIRQLMAGCTTAVSCVTYHYNYQLALTALEAGVNFVDLGGNDEVTAKQFLLSDQAKERGIAIVPDCGLAPGLVSILAAAATEDLEEIYSLQLRVGGLPVDPQPPLNYSLVFSTEGLINEYVEPATVIRNGKLMRLAALAELENIEFPPPFGMLEAFSTHGGVSSLPTTFSGRVQELDYKTIRYPGHCQQIRLLKDLGLMDAHARGPENISPRDMLSCLLKEKLPTNSPDVVLLRVTATGRKGGNSCEITWEGIEYMDQGRGLSAMARMTAFPASIIAQMVSRGDIHAAGTLTQETSTPTGIFLAELSRRGIQLSRTEKSLAAQGSRIS